jgi:hypothetical protein
MIRLIPAALLAIACTACANRGGDAPSAGAQPPMSGKQCDATPVQSFVGQAGNVANVERIKAASGARDVRRYETGSALTMDFRPDRVNVEVGKDGNIVKIGCG